MKYLIGIDLGTSALKTVLFDETGRSVASASEVYPMYQPQNGWAEQAPEHWWKACVSTLNQVLDKTSVPREDIAGIGISGQMHGLVMLDESGEVLRNCILWCDGRTVRECDEITETVGAGRLIQITANPALPGFTAGKILWVRRNEPDLYKRCKHILLPKDYLRYKLCGVYAAEVSDASGTNLLDVPKRKWSEEILELLDIDPAVLPPVYESYEVTGEVTREAAEATGLAAGTPVVGGAGDNMAAAVGTGVVEAGKAFVTIGTSGVIFAHSDNVTIDPLGRVHTFCSAVPGAWATMSCSLAAGGSLQWFRNTFYGEDAAYPTLIAGAEKVPIGANRLLFLPYLMGERSPLLDANARGVFFGLSAMHGKDEMLRALLEGVTYSLRDSLEVLREMGVPFSELLATGGGARSPFWRQMIADNFNCPVLSGGNDEGPALGVAILAGAGTGLFSDIPSACRSIIQNAERQNPTVENQGAYDSYFALYREIYRSLKQNFQTLANMYSLAQR